MVNGRTTPLLLAPVAAALLALAPLAAALILALVVMVFETDLGAALLVYMTFLTMVYIATGRVSWVLIGIGVFAAASVAVRTGVSRHAGSRPSRRSGRRCGPGRPARRRERAVGGSEAGGGGSGLRPERRPAWGGSWCLRGGPRRMPRSAISPSRTVSGHGG